MKRFSIFMTVIVILSAGAAWAERMSVKVPLANIRSGPGTKYEIQWKVEKYHPVEIIKKSGTWYHFKDFEGDRGWISNTLIAKIPSVIVKKKKCNVRSGPGTNHGIVFTVEKGVPFKILERKGVWIHVMHADGDKGWVHANLVW